MKTPSLLILSAAFLLLGTGIAAQPSIGGFNVYYGHLHNHCNISDGVQTPDYAYNYAKNKGDLDFFSLSDHSSDISSSEWTAMQTAADAYNEPGVFTTFRGFEWTENVRGHVAVINSSDYITTAAPNNTFEGLCNWLNGNECVAFFNHPGRNNSTGLEFGHFNTFPTDKIVGMELWNNTNGFNTYYYTDGYYTGDGNLSWYDEALTRGWKIGASGSEDNHSGTWGTLSQSKMAVLATANTREDIMDALKARRFYTTNDKNLALSFRIGGSEMGSTVTGGSSDLQIQASDADNEVFTQIQLLKNGIVVNTWAPNSANPSYSIQLTCCTGDYFYIRVRQADGDEAISSPIQVSGGPDGPVMRSAIIATAMDDLEEGYNGVTYPSSTDLELAYDGGTAAGLQTIGLRFTGLLVPKNAIISNAYIQFTCDEVNTAACSLTIKGEAADNSAAFTTAAFNLSGRAKTSSSVSWVPPGWPTANAAGPDQRTPGLFSIIQEIVNRAGYAQASAISLFITGTGTRVAEAYEGAPASTARLVVEYTISTVNQPPVISLTSPANGTTLTEPAVVEIIANASDPDGTINKVEFYMGATLIGQDLTSPYSYTLTGLAAGTYNLYATATDNPGASTVSATVAVTVTAAQISSTFSKRISAGSDDAEEYSSGTVTRTSSSLKLVYNSLITGNQTIGLRFTGVTIPVGATVTKAYIQFGCSQKNTATCKLTVNGEYSGSSAAFTTARKNISGRTRTGVKVSWSPAGWSTTGATGEAQQTPDLKTIIQEVIGHAGWSSGNNMTFIITGTGTRTAYAYEGSSSKAAQLYVEYTSSGGKAGLITSGHEPGMQIPENPALENRLICYPVPFTDQLHIRITTEKNENIRSISLLNTNGIVVRDLATQDPQMTIHAGDLPKGVYIVLVRTNLAVYRKTLVKI